LQKFVRSSEKLTEVGNIFHRLVALFTYVWFCLA
jgi:hypothetical protein